MTTPAVNAPAIIHQNCVFDWTVRRVLQVSKQCQKKQQKQTNKKPKKNKQCKAQLELRGFGDAIVRDRGSDSRCGSTHDTHVKRVSQRSPESRGFPLGTLVPPTGNVDRVGWDKVRHES